MWRSTAILVTIKKHDPQNVRPNNINMWPAIRKGAFGEDGIIHVVKQNQFNMLSTNNIITSVIAIYFSETSNICPVRVLNREIWYRHK